MTKRPKFLLFSELNNMDPSYSVYYIKKERCIHPMLENSK